MSRWPLKRCATLSRNPREPAKLCKSIEAATGAVHAPVLTVPSHRTVAWCPSQLQKSPGILAVDSRLDVIRKLQRVEQLKLRNFLASHQEIGPEDKLCGVADDELAAEPGIARDGLFASRFREIAIQVGILVHQPVECSPGSGRLGNIGIPSEIGERRVTGDRCPESRRVADER